MARIPRLTDSRRVQQRGLPDGSINPATPAGTFGPDLGPAADQLGQIALRAADRANTARVMEADNALSEFENAALYDPESGALNARGKNAFGLPDTVMQSYDQRVAEIRDGLVGAQRSAFDRLAAQRRRSVDSTIQRHVHSQIGTYEQEQADALITNSQLSAANHYNDPERIATELQRQRATITTRARDLGWSDEQTQLALQKAQSATQASVVQQMADNDPQGALQRFNEVKAQILPDDRSRLEPAIKRIEAQQIADSLSGAFTGVRMPSDGDLWERLIQRESRGNQFDSDGQPLTSSAGAVGVAQLLPGTAREAANLAGLEWDPQRFRNDADYNEALGRAYFDKQMQDFGMPLLAAAAYNAGPGMVNDWINGTNRTGKNESRLRLGDPRSGEITPEEFAQRIPFQETRDYVGNVVGQDSYGAVTGEFGMRDALQRIQQIEDPDVRQQALSLFTSQRNQFNQLRAVEQAELDSRVEDAQAAYLQGLTFESPPSQADFLRAYGAEGGSRYEAFRKVRGVGEALQQIALATPDERRELLSSFRPEQQDGAAGEGFAEDARLFGVLMDAAQRMEDQMEDDPVTYLNRHSTQIQAMAAATGDGSPAALDAYASALVAEQQRLGISQPQLLTEQQKAEIVSGFRSTEDGGDNAAQLISGLQSEWGRHWPTVFRQLQDELPNAALVIGTGVDGATASRLARIANIPTEDLRKGLESTVTRDVTDELNDRFADFRVTLQNQAGGERTFAALYEEAQRLSLSYAAEGDGAKDAADRAFSSLVDDRYTINGTYRVPRDVDADLVERGADAELESIDPAQLQYERQEWMDEEFATQQIRNVLRESAYWVTSPDESGLVLYVNGEAVLTRDGDPVTRSWADLSARADEQEPGLWQRFQEGRRQAQDVRRETSTRAWEVRQ